MKMNRNNKRKTHEFVFDSISYYNNGDKSSPTYFY